MEWNEHFGMEPGPVFCLQVRGWVPAGVKDDDTVCSSYVQAHSSAPAGKRRTDVCVCVCVCGGGGEEEGVQGDEWVLCESPWYG